MSGWILDEERRLIGADFQDFEARCFVGPPRDNILQGRLSQDTPLDVSGVTRLTSALATTDTSMSVESTGGFPDDGALFAGNEFIEYTGKTSTTFTGLLRRNAQHHDADSIVQQFVDVSDRVYNFSLNGNIDSHEFAGTLTGENYDHQLFKPDRSVYIEYRYYPFYGYPGPRIGAGFTDVTGESVEELFTVKDADGTTRSPVGMDWGNDGNLWIATDDDQILKVNPNSGEVILTLGHSQTNLDGLAITQDAVWVATNNTVAKLDPASGTIVLGFEVTNAKGLCTDNTDLFVIDSSLKIHNYGTDGSLNWTIDGPAIDPSGIAYWDGSLWVLDQGFRLFEIDRRTGDVYRILDMAEVTNAQCLALSSLGGRIGDATSNKVYRLSLGASQGTSGGNLILESIEKFTTPDGIKGMSYATDADLWIVTDADAILKVDRDDGTVNDSFAAPVSGLECVTIGGSSGYVWVGSSSGATKHLYKINTGTHSIDGSIEVPNNETPTGLTFDGATLWFVTDAGTIYNYTEAGVEIQNFDRDIQNAEGLVSYNSRLYVLTTTKIMVMDDLHGFLQDVLVMPDGITDPQGLVLHATHGHRVGDATSDKVYQLTFAYEQDVQEGTGGWSEWLPFYFGYIERGSITADYLEKTWQLNTRSTWMYLGSESADGRTLAPENIAEFKPTTCSGVLSDPALEIGVEYVSVPGEGVGCNNAVDGDLNTVWISQDIATQTEGPDPLARADYADSAPSYAPGSTCDEVTTYAVTGIQVPTWPGDDMVPDNTYRRGIFTEIHKPRLGIRPESGWWMEIRNMSDENPFGFLPEGIPGVPLNNTFLVIRYTDEDGNEQVVNIDLNELPVPGEEWTIGPKTSGSGVYAFNAAEACQKGWLIITGDEDEFRRWWLSSEGLAFIGPYFKDLRQVTTGWPGFEGDPIRFNFRNGDLKLYFQGNWPHEEGSEDSTLRGNITATDTSIPVQAIGTWPEHGLGIIKGDSLTGGPWKHEPYEWIEWTSKGAGSRLEGVRRGVEGTPALAWRFGTLGTPPQGTTVRWFYDLEDAESIEVPVKPNGNYVTGDTRLKLSDWVVFGTQGEGRINQYTNARSVGNIRHGNSYFRLGENGWQWTDWQTPLPGSKNRPDKPQWISVDLEEIVPPTLGAAVGIADTTFTIEGNVDKLFNSGVLIVDLEEIRYTISRASDGTSATITVLERGVGDTVAAAHDEGAQVWQEVDGGALVEHLVSGVRWARTPNAGTGIPENYKIYMTWRPQPRYPGEASWGDDWDLIWTVQNNTVTSRAHFISEFADLDTGANVTRPPGELNYYRARHVLLEIESTNTGRAKINEFEVYGLNPRLNLLAGSLSEEGGDDSEVAELNNTIAVMFDYVIRGFGMEPEEVKVVGPGVNFFELPIAGGPYTSILSSLADNTGYAIWFNRWNQLWFMPDPAFKRGMPVMTDLDNTLMRGQIQILSQPSGRVSQVTVYFYNDLTDETIPVSYPTAPLSTGNPVDLDSTVVASEEEAFNIARQLFQETNGEWEIEVPFGVAPQFVLGHRYTVTYDEWEASRTYFQGASFYVAGLNFNLTFGPDKKWTTNVRLKEYHVSTIREEPNR